MEKLSPRQHDCLRLVWTKQATSKEIAAELGISKSTVDGYIAEAVDLLAARDRREAARMVFGDVPMATRAGSGGDAAGVASLPIAMPPDAASTEGSPASRPWRTRGQRNTLTLAQTLGWIVIFAIGSLLALMLAIVIGTGVPPVVRSAQGVFGRLMH